MLAALASVATTPLSASLARLDSIDRALASNGENFDNTALAELQQRSIFARAAVINDGPATSAGTTRAIAELERDVIWAQNLFPGVSLSRKNAAFIGGGVLLAGAAGIFLMRAMRGKGRRR